MCFAKVLARTFSRCSASSSCLWRLCQAASAPAITFLFAWSRWDSARTRPPSSLPAMPAVPVRDFSSPLASAIEVCSFWSRASSSFARPASALPAAISSLSNCASVPLTIAMPFASAWMRASSPLAFPASSAAFFDSTSLALAMALLSLASRTASALLRDCSPALVKASAALNCAVSPRRFRCLARTPSPRFFSPSPRFFSRPFAFLSAARSLASTSFALPSCVFSARDRRARALLMAAATPSKLLATDFMTVKSFWLSSLRLYSSLTLCSSFFSLVFSWPLAVPSCFFSLVLRVASATFAFERAFSRCPSAFCRFVSSTSTTFSSSPAPSLHA
mmetsp:Transcript_20455/g.46555  ORF Transcript_20455/g.46555 Transcript_20455/m.46555 type:complete len:334 (+) Transcript_20455:248-1249(+)